MLQISSAQPTCFRAVFCNTFRSKGHAADFYMAQIHLESLLICYGNVSWLYGKKFDVVFVYLNPVLNSWLADHVEDGPG